MSACSSRPQMSAALADPQLRRDLVRVVARRVDPSDVEDLVQATLTEALVASEASGGASKEAFMAQRCPETEEETRRFVFAIARQRVIDSYRRRDRERRRVLPEVEPTQPLGPSMDLLRWAEGELPSAPDATETFDWMLREGEGETLADIALEEQVPAPVVRQRVSRLRRYFRGRWTREIAALGLLGVIVVECGLFFRSQRSTWTRTDDVAASASVPSNIRPDPSAPLPSSAPAPANELGPFDRGAAAHALGSVKIQDCKIAGGPSGAGHITVTFANSGRASSAVVDGGPFINTPEGDCVAGKFAAVTIPPFNGTPVRVGKSFVLN